MILNFLGKYSLVLSGILIVALAASGWYIKTLIKENGSLEEINSQFESTIEEQKDTIENQIKQHQIDLNILQERDISIRVLRKSRAEGENILNRVEVDEKTRECLYSLMPDAYIKLLRIAKEKEGVSQ